MVPFSPDQLRSVAAYTRMADTPTYQAPVDPKEQSVLDALMLIRAELTLLKQDKSTYVKSSDVIALYDKVDEQVRILNELRSDHPKEENRGELMLPTSYMPYQTAYIGNFEQSIVSWKAAFNFCHCSS